MIFLVESDKSYAASYIDKIQLDLFGSRVLIWICTQVGFFLVLAIILLIVLWIARSIQRAIVYMKDKTNELKKANNV